MNNTQKIFMQILSDFVNERKLEITTEYSAKALYDLAYAQSLAGVAGYMLFHAENPPKPEALADFEKSYGRTVSQFIRRDVYSAQVFKKLGEAGIKHIVFKGTVLKEVYPVKELRTYSDVDIIIEQKNRQKAHQLMINEGFAFLVMDGGDVYSYQKGIEHYEIHTSLNSELVNKSDYMRNFWEHTVVRNGLTLEFEPDFHLCYLISHIEKHVYGTGAGPRLYMDIALFIKHYKGEIDFVKVRQILGSCGLEKFFDTVLYLCKRWFDSDVEPNTVLSEDTYNKFCDITLSGGTFGVTTIVTEHGEVRNVTVSDRKGKLKLVLASVFPPYREIRRLYPAFDGKPFLLPVAWCVHIVKAGKRSGTKNIRQIMVSDTHKGKEERELLKEVGSQR